MTSTPSSPVITRRPGPDTFDSLDPATGEVLGTYPVHDAEAVDAAVAGARAGAGFWSPLPFADRGRRLTTWAAVLTRRMGQLVLNGAEDSHVFGLSAALVMPTGSGAGRAGRRRHRADDHPQVLVTCGSPWPRGGAAWGRCRVMVIAPGKLRAAAASARLQHQSPPSG